MLPMFPDIAIHILVDDFAAAQAMKRDNGAARPDQASKSEAGAS
jgi:hypothetical protein